MHILQQLQTLQQIKIFVSFCSSMSFSLYLCNLYFLYSIYIISFIIDHVMQLDLVFVNNHGSCSYYFINHLSRSCLVACQQYIRKKVYLSPIVDIILKEKDEQQMLKLHQSATFICSF